MTNKTMECVMCPNIATTEVLDVYMVDTLEVCEDCYKEVFRDVADEGKEYFYEWAIEMYNDEEKANYLCELIYGSGVDEDMKVGAGEMMWLFTFGILKYPHNIQREGGIDIVENSIVRGHVMHLYGASFPVTRMTGNDKDVIFGTLFQVPKRQVLYSYDYTEGYKPNRPASENMYNRIEVEVTRPDGTKQMAQMYYANQESFAGHINEFTRIPTGNFDDKHLAKSYDFYRKENRKNRKKAK